MYFIKMMFCTLRYDFSLFTQYIHLKQWSKQQSHQLPIRSVIQPSSTLVKYKTNVYQSTLVEIKLKLDISSSYIIQWKPMEEESFPWLTRGGGIPWFHSSEHSMWPSTDHFNHLTTNGSCQRVKYSHSRCQMQ